MPSERSFQDRIQRSTKLKHAVSNMTPTYAPADAKFTIAALGTAITHAAAASTDVDDKHLPYDDAVSDRRALVKTLSTLVTQSLAYVKSNTAWARRFKTIKNAADKVRGVHPKPTPKRPLPAPDPKTSESGQRSYVQIAAFLQNYLNRLAALTTYAPPDTKITLATLQATWLELDTLNTSVSDLAQLLADAIRDRKDSMAALKTTYDGVKTSVKAQYGPKSPEYTAISSLKW